MSNPHIQQLTKALNLEAVQPFLDLHGVPFLTGCLNDDLLAVADESLQVPLMRLRFATGSHRMDSKMGLELKLHLEVPFRHHLVMDEYFAYLSDLARGTFTSRFRVAPAPGTNAFFGANIKAVCAFCPLLAVNGPKLTPGPNPAGDPGPSDLQHAYVNMRYAALVNVASAFAHSLVSPLVTFDRILNILARHAPLRATSSSQPSPRFSEADSIAFPVARLSQYHPLRYTDVVPLVSFAYLTKNQNKKRGFALTPSKKFPMPYRVSPDRSVAYLDLPTPDKRNAFALIQFASACALLYIDIVFPHPPPLTAPVAPFVWFTDDAVRASIREAVSDYELRPYLSAPPPSIPLPATSTPSSSASSSSSNPPAATPG